MTNITLRHSLIEWTNWGCITYFQDESSIGAHPHDTHHYHIVAARHGHCDDVLMFCQYHEVCHSVWAEWVHNAPSKVLWALAHGKMLSGKESVEEELCVQALHRWITTSEQPIVSGVDWFALKRYALEKLDGQSG